ncbi:MAG: helix-turn-helix transcriptional regulator [Pseudohongiellaceae bacterium]
MKKSERLLQLLVLLRSKRRASTAADLAARLRVSERTIYRDIQSLILSGVDIQGEAGVGYMLQAGSEVPPLMFSEKELEALVLGIRLVKGWGDDDLIEAADKAQSKIQAVLPERILQAHENKLTKYLVPDFKRRTRVKFSELLREAIDGLSVVTIDYCDESQQSSQRKVNPLGLMFWGETWTVVCWCQLRNDYRLFRLDRIESATLLNESFETSANCCLSHYLKNYDIDVSINFWDS